MRVLPGLLGREAARDLAHQTDTMSGAERVPLESSDLGPGEQIYFGAGLPAPLKGWRTAFYHHLAVIANRWNEVLNDGNHYPMDLAVLRCRRSHVAGM